LFQCECILKEIAVVNDSYNIEHKSVPFNDVKTVAYYLASEALEKSEMEDFLAKNLFKV